MKQLWFGGIAGLAALLISAGGAAAVRPELGMLAAGLRVPVGAVWLVGPMVLAVVGAVTVGWRRAATENRSRAADER